MKKPVQKKFDRAQPDGDVNKLQVWAQRYIERLESQRDTAVSALGRWVENQKKQPIFVDEMVSLESSKVVRRYVSGNSIQVEWLGVELRVLLREDSFELAWSDSGRLSQEVAFVPTAFQQARLIAKRRMR